MSMWYLIAQVATITLFPWLSRRISRQNRFLPAIILCYLAGILVRNLHLWPLQDALSQRFTEVSILIAIPLLLFGTRLSRIKDLAGKALWSFVLCVLAGLLASTLAAVVFHDTFPDSWAVAGMLTGIYTGGTPNMQAIGLALQVDQAYIIMLNAADIVLGGAYLILLTTVMHPLLGYVLPHFVANGEIQTDLTEETDWHAPAVLGSLGLTVLIIGISLSTTYLIFGDLSSTGFLMLILTTLSLAATGMPVVQRWEKTFETGEYFLLTFSVALGMLADLRAIAQTGGSILAFSGTVMIVTIALHLWWARWARIDRDTFLITSTAALYGPAFVGPMAMVMKNRAVLFPGMVTGLLGYAVGNYLGITLAWILRWWLASG